MSDSEQQRADRDPGKGERDLTQEERATQAINAIFSGGDLTEETMRLSNEFTDRQSSRLARWFRRPQDRG